LARAVEAVESIKNKMDMGRITSPCVQFLMRRTPIEHHAAVNSLCGSDVERKDAMRNKVCQNVKRLCRYAVNHNDCWAK
jgi:hypothetical protein